LYFSVLSRLVAQWLNDPNFSHGFFVPLFVLFVLWQNRTKLRSIQLRPSWSGVAILCFGLTTLVIGVLGAELFLSRASLLIVVAGLVVLFCGWTMFRAVLFPWAFLTLMIPIPTIIFNQINVPSPDTRLQTGKLDSPYPWCAGIARRQRDSVAGNGS
jgi:exosortase